MRPGAHERPVHRPFPRVLSTALVAIGLAAAVVFEGVAAPHQSGPERHLLGGWLTASTVGPRLLGIHSDRSTVVGASLLLLLAWLGVALLLLRNPVRLRVVSAWSGLWLTPFALGVPVLSRDCYAYLAQGEIARLGYDAYRTPVAALGARHPLLLAVDPLWRHTIPPYGPLGLRASELAAVAAHAARSPVVGLLALRLLALAGVLLAAACVCRLAPPARRALALWLVLSPLVMFHLVGAAHLDGLLYGLLAAAVLALRTDRGVAALLLLALAVAIKVTAVLLLVAVLLGRLRSASSLRTGLRAAAVPAAQAAATLLGVLLLTGWPDPFGWVRGLATPGTVWDPLAPSSALMLVARHAAPLVGIPVDGGLLSGLRLFALLLGGVIALVIARGAGRRDTALVAAYLTADLVLCGPVLWPWYFAPLAVLLLLTPPGRRWLVAAACGSAPAMAGLPLPVVTMQRVAYAAGAIAVLALLALRLPWARARIAVAMDLNAWRSDELPTVEP